MGASEQEARHGSEACAEVRGGDLTTSPRCRSSRKDGMSWASSARRERLARVGNAGALEEAPMAIVAGFDVHRAQITFDALDTETGEVSRGRIDATPAAVARWVKRF